VGAGGRMDSPGMRKDAPEHWWWRRRRRRWRRWRRESYRDGPNRIRPDR